MKRLLLLLALLVSVVSTFAHTWEIRVKQNQDGTLTWYGQSYHGLSECGHANSGININGVNYNWTAEAAGSVIGQNATIFTASPSLTSSDNSCGGCQRGSYATVTTPYIAGALSVTAYSTNACWDLYPDMPAGNGSFNPPPPPVCTTCPLTSWTSSVASVGNNNGTPCNVADDYTTATIQVNHLACANITGDKQFRVIFNSGGTNVVYGPYNYASGIQTNVTINVPSGTTTSTPVKVIDDDFPCEITHGLNSGYSGEPGTDTDGDGILDACDADDDNDGIPDVAECKSNFYWSNAPTESGNTATGVINGVNYTYTSSRTVETSSSVFAHNVFPSSYNVPNIKCILNQYASHNTLSFATPITNPVLVFSSIGGGPISVPIEFSSPVQVLWSTAVVQNTPTRITGTEGYAIVRLNGTFSSISFDYLADEYYVNFLFGADFQTCGDTDGDGIPDKLDVDSDGDGCSDAIEGDQHPLAAQIVNGRLTGGVDANGIPLIVNGGQGLGNSQISDVNCNCQRGVDRTPPTITCPADIVKVNDANRCGAVVTYALPVATDNCSGGAFNYFNAGEPNNAGSEDHLQLYTSGTWNDLNGGNGGLSYIIEINSVYTNAITNYTRLGEFGGHTYYKSNFNATWYTARSNALALGIGADLASINTLGESSFLAPYGGSVWVGGYQDHSDPDYAEPGNASQNWGGWRWVDGTKLGAGQIAINRTAGFASGTMFPVGTTTVTHTATDLAGNVSSCSFTVTVTDTQKPVITTNGNQSATTTAGTCSANVAVSATATDNCTVGTPTGVRSDNQPLNAAYPRGTTTITWNVTDVNGVAAIPVTQTVTVTDNQAPVPTVATLPTITSECSASVTAPTATDACAGIITGTTTDATSYTTQGTFVVHWTYNDGNGNTSTQNQTVIIDDNTPPVIACPFNITTTSVAGQCGANVSYNQPSATDNCGSGVLPTSLNGFTYKGTMNGHAYFISNNQDIPENAHANAIALGGHLVTINSAAENAFVSGMNADRIWIGFTDRDVEGNFKWITNEPITYTNWSGGEPNNAGGNEDWAVINWSGPTWNDWYYTQPAFYVVEFEGGSIPTTLVSGPASGGFFPVGTTPVTYRATDAGGNSVSCTFFVTVTDNQKPVITTNGNQNVFALPGQCSANPIVTASATDNCNVGAPVGLRNDGQALNAPYRVGTTTITWNVTDANGNAALPVTQTVTVTDNQKPVITTSGDKNVFALPGLCSANPIVNASASDNCNVGVPTGVRNDGQALNAPYPVGTTTVTWNVTDVNGNTAVPVIQTIIVTDNQLPVVTCPANQQIDLDGSCSATLPDYTSQVSSSDNCGVASVTQNPAAGTTISGTGTMTVNFTVTDLSGNTSNCSITVTKNDVTPPVITCPSPVTVNNDPGVCGAVVNFPVPLATDNCSSVSVNGSQTFSYSGSIQNFTVPAGVTSIKIVAKGAQGGNNGGRGAIMGGDFAVTPGATYKILVGGQGQTNFIQCGQHFGSGGGGGTFVSTSTNTPLIVAGGGGGSVCAPFANMDATTATNGFNGNSPAAPSLIGYGGTNGNGATGSGPHAGNGGGFLTAGQVAQCGGPGAAFISGGAGGTPCGSGNAGGIGGGGGGGNAGGGGGGGYTGGGGSYHYPGNGGGAGSFNSGANQQNTVGNLGNGQVEISWSVSTVTQTAGLPSGSVFPVGTTTNTFVAKDASGNASTCSFTVTVVDNESPKLVGVPANTTVECTAVPAPANVTATDNCPAVGAVQYNEVKTNGNCAGNYTLTRTWTVTDIHNNTTSATQVVTVQDTKAPVLTVPADIAQTNDAGQCGAIITFLATASDDCSNAHITYSHQSGSLFPVGQTLVTVTANDDCNNVVIKTFTVTITDNESPVLVGVPANKTVECTSVPAAANVTATDNCPALGAVQYDEVKTNGNCAGNYTLTRTWTVTDAHNNTTSATQVITVQDTKAPVLSVPANIVVSNDPGQCGAKVSYAGTAADDCSNATITYSIQPGSFFAKGETTVTVTATDDCGNNTSNTFTVTVNDTENPTIVCVANQSKVVDNAGCSYLVKGTEFDATFADNCPGSTVTNSYNGSSTLAGATFPKGTTNVSWTVTDASGNTASCSYTVTVTTSIAAYISTSNVLPQGTQPNTIYVGYTPASTLTLKANPSGGGGTYTYNWTVSSNLQITGSNTGSTVQVTTNTPGSASPYTVNLVVTDQFGCFVAAQTWTVKVIDVRCGNKNDKVLVCQKTSSTTNPWVQICIAPAAVATHLGNGSTLGACPTTTARGTTPEPVVKATAIKAYPNPSTGVFELQLQNYNKGKVEIQVIDNYGKLVAKQSMMISASVENVTMDIRKHASGVYQVRVVSEDGVKTLKVIVAR